MYDSFKRVVNYEDIDKLQNKIYRFFESYGRAHFKVYRQEHPQEQRV